MEDNKKQIIESSVPSASAAEVLSNLDIYYKTQIKASEEFKAAMMNLLKAKQHKGSGSIGADPYSSNDVREELYAQTRVQVVVIDDSVLSSEDVPELIDEEEDDFTHANKICAAVEFKLVRGKKGTKKVKQNDQSTSTKVKSEGLRQRKKGADGSKENNNETSKQSVDNWIEDDPLYEKQKQKQLESDPIDLFGGFPPPSLRKAQQHAQSALNHYIKAAHTASIILEQVNNESAAEKE